MKKSLFKADVAGFIFVSILGTFSHFLFEFFGESKFIALFCPVNESVWEHLKLLYFPFLLYTIIEYFILKKQRDFFYAKFSGVFWGMIFMTAFFYTYSGILGKNILFIDILTFLISVFISFLISHAMLINEKQSTEHADTAAIILFISMSALFFIFTFSPPFIHVFKDTSNGIYGI